MSQITAYMSVFFAHLIFSSSQIEVVYRIPAYTINPIAKSAHSSITRSATCITSSLISGFQVQSATATALVEDDAQSVRKSTAP